MSFSDIRVVATSDLHGNLPAVPACDLLVIAGDICPDGPGQADWLHTRFRDWLDGSRVPTVAVWGNHDFVGEHPKLVPALPWTLLSDSGCAIDSLRLWGSPYSVSFGPWAFMEPDALLADRWSLMPADLDILIVHGPPGGVCDRTVAGESAGSVTLRERIEAVTPKALVCGHIHEASGYGRIGPTEVWNVSHVDVRYQPTTPPVIVRDVKVAYASRRRDHPHGGPRTRLE